MDALEALLAREHVAALPRFALGASSGGAFVALLPFHARTRFAALCIQIMGVPPDMLTAPLPDGAGAGASSNAAYPPSLWVHMPRDGRIASVVRADVDALRQAGAVAEEIRIEPQAVTPTFLSDRVRGVSPDASAAAREALRAAGLLNGTGFLLSDPRRSEWRHALRNVTRPALANDTLAPDASPIAEELNVAWAAHELTADAMNETLAFFSAHAGAAAQARALTPTAEDNSTRAEGS